MKTDFVEKIEDFRRWAKKFTTERLIRPARRFLLLDSEPAAIEEIPESAVAVETDVEEDDWKEKALADFRSWLDDLPETPSPGESAGPESCDLFTLLSEFTALRQEIRMQNREQNKGILTVNQFIDESRKLQTVIDSFGEKNQRIADAFSAVTDEFQRFEDRMRQAFEGKVEDILRTNWKLEIEKSAVQPFLDVRDALVRGLKAAQAISEPKGLFRSSAKGVEGVAEGYAMTLRRFDRALSNVGIQPVNAVGKPFDPKIMRAVDSRPGSEGEKGIVIEEQLGGFVRGDEVIRTAEVIVTV